MSTVQTLDPIYVDITQFAEELLKIRHEVAGGELTSGVPLFTDVALKLADGSDYPLTERLNLADVTVEQSTGAVTLRAIFPNPEGILLPGLYLRAVVNEGTKSNAILAPQRG